MRRLLLIALAAGCGSEAGLNNQGKTGVGTETIPGGGTTTSTTDTDTTPGTDTPPTFGTTDTGSPGTGTNPPGTGPGNPPGTGTNPPGTGTGTPTDPPTWTVPPSDTGTGTSDLEGGHFDVDTASFVAEIGRGSTDAHVHEYDDRYGVSGVDAFVFHEASLHEIFEDITDPDQAFKILVINADLSPGGRLVLNNVYAPGNPRTWIPVTTYDDTPVASLDVYSLSGANGTRELRELGLYFDPQAILNRELVPTQTGCVRDNELGVNGSWRNGAITLQAVAVDATGADAFTTDAAMSQGGHPVATSGLLWELTLFWHWDGPCSHEPDWSTYVPTP